MRFKVAEHIFSLSIPDRYSYMLNAYRPFEYERECVEELYHIEVVDSLTYNITKPLLEDVELSDELMVRVNVYETAEGLLYSIIMPRSSVINAQLHIVGATARITINDESDSDFNKVSAFNNAMILSYITYTLPHNTLLLHASAILKDSRAHLFIGKSGTGKSTHSRMWLESLPDTELLNDDHPVVRRHESGEVIAYGSPWSGKTPCYRNLSAPLRAIVRIKRAEYNKLNRLTAIRGYASVMTSCSGAQWSRELSAAKVKALESIITQVGCYEMECLPNNEAARVCYESLCAEKL
ncbi:MAG: hypothetical protein SNH55_08705 [Rikenellaceae bacterium]